MSLDSRRLDAPPTSTARYDSALAQLEREMIRGVNEEMRGQDAGRVHDVLVNRFKGRLPAAELDDGKLRKIAAAISKGTLTL